MDIVSFARRNEGMLQAHYNFATAFLRKGQAILERMGEDHGDEWIKSLINTTPPAAQSAPVQEYVKPTAQEMHNAAANLALMREMWGDPNQPAAKVNDEGFIVETGLLLSPGTLLYTIPSAQHTWIGLTPKEVADIVVYPMNKTADLVRVIEAKLKEKNT